MKAVMCTRVGNMKDSDLEKRGLIEVVETDEPQVGEGQVKIKVAYCGICGSDPHTVAGNFNRIPPFSIGHEMSGIVTKVGKNAVINGLEVGDRVSGNFRRTCGKCYDCLNEQEQFCKKCGIPAPCMAEYTVWDEKQVVKLPDGVSLLQGALLEPASIAMRAADKCGMKPGENVLVSGGGPIGLLICQMMNMCGAANLTLLEPDSARRTLGKKYGVRHTFDPREDVDAALMCITEGRGFDILFEVSGIPSAAESMLSYSANLANIMYIAQYPKDYNLPLNLYAQIYEKEVSIMGIFVSPYTFTRTARLLERFDLEDFTDTVFYIDDVKEAFEAHLSGRHTKVIVQCNPECE